MQGRVMVNRKEPILELVPQRGHSWTIRGARTRFGEVFQRARTEGPQRITPQGKEAVVMMAEEQYDLLVRKSHGPKSLVQFFRESPLVGVDLDLEREREGGVQRIEKTRSPSA